ncbi:MAG: hypothetical protein JWR04_1808 [Rhodoglobus sp.]|jgi:hypothetical protein|nr:hypothetical protein [Rhodoglobus sp.]
MTETTTTGTSDALTTLNLPAKFDVTKFPREVEEYLGRTADPFHRAILKNYFRHLLLEISGYWDQILVPELTVAEPAYRIGDRGDMIVLTGKTEVESFYRETFETDKNVMGALTMNMCVEDFGIVTEARWAEVTTGATVVARGIDADPAAHYLLTHNIFQMFAYTHDAKLIGERVYDDPASYHYEKLDPADVVTPADARRELAPFLARATLDVWNGTEFVAG